MIVARTPAHAERRVRDVLQQALSCVTAGVFVYGLRSVTTELSQTSRLARSGGGHVTLTVDHRYSVVNVADGDRAASWQARTAAYMYTLEDADGLEILAYHWHPAGRSPVSEPHLHIGGGAGALRTELQKAHIATGPVTPVALLSLLIDAFAVRPRRPDWRPVLLRARQALDLS